MYGVKNTRKNTNNLNLITLFCNDFNFCKKKYSFKILLILFGILYLKLLYFNVYETILLTEY